MARRSEQRIRDRITHNENVIREYQTTEYIDNSPSAIKYREEVVQYRAAENETLKWVLKESK